MRLGSWPWGVMPITELAAILILGVTKRTLAMNEAAYTLTHR